jgi:hypothetical protein
MVKKKKEEGNVMETYETTVRYNCPKRGWVEEKVMIKRYKEKEEPKNTMDTSKILGEKPEEHSDDTNYN